MNLQLISRAFCISLKAVVAVLLLSAPVAAQSLPTPVIAIVDTNRILQESLASQSILKQVDALNSKLQADAAALEKKLAAERTELEKQRSVLKPDVFRDRVNKFEDKVRDAQRDLQEKTRQVQLSLQYANLDLRKALEPILKELMLRRGANLLFEKARIAYNTPDFDITTEALDRLDKSTSKITVKFPPPEQ